MNQKLLYSNKISTYLLKKYFNIKFYFQKKQNKNDEMSKLLEDEDNKKKQISKILITQIQLLINN